MILKMFEQNLLIYGMLGLCGIGVFLKLILTIVYSNLIKASDQMGTAKNKLMKALKTRFETSYSLKMNVNNVDSFVDKYVYKHKFCGIRLYTWENFCGQLLLLCMLIGSIGAIAAILYDCGKKTVLSTFLVGISTSAVLIVVDNMANLSMKRNVIKTNISDYLENFLKSRLESEKRRTVMAEEETKMETQQAEVMEGDVMEVRKKQSESKEEEKIVQDISKRYETTEEEEQIIKDILKEYIV